MVNQETESNELKEISSLRSSLESKIRSKLRNVINETESRGLSRFRTFTAELLDPSSAHADQRIHIKIKDSSDGKMYFRIGEQRIGDNRYLISEYSNANAKDLVEAVRVLKIIVEFLKNKEGQDITDMEQAKKELEDL